MSEQRQVIWESILDDKFACKVTRIDGDTGELTIERDGKRLHGPIVVPLWYQALFGPDIADVAVWQETCAKLVDSGDDS